MLSAIRKIATVQRSPARFLSAATEAATQIDTNATNNHTQFKTKTVRNIRDRVLIEHLVDNDKVYFVTLDRADKLNSLDMEMFLAITEAADDLKTRKNARVAIMRGNGRTFCTGLDVKTVAKDPRNMKQLLVKPGSTPQSNLAQDVSYMWRNLPIPVIASLHGMCFGGGFQIALGADFRFATPDAKLSIMEAKWGLIPDMGITVAARELMRADILKELTMTARIFSGTEGVEYGCVTRTCADPLAESIKLAEEICEKSPDMVASAKDLFNQTHAQGTDKMALDLETELQTKIIAKMNENGGFMKAPQ